MSPEKDYLYAVNRKSWYHKLCMKKSKKEDAAGDFLYRPIDNERNTFSGYRMAYNSKYLFVAIHGNPNFLTMIPFRNLRTEKYFYDDNHDKYEILKVTEDNKYLFTVDESGNLVQWPIEGKESIQDFCQITDTKITCMAN